MSPLSPAIRIDYPADSPSAARILRYCLSLETYLPPLPSTRAPVNLPEEVTCPTRPAVEALIPFVEYCCLNLAIIQNVLDVRHYISYYSKRG